MGLTRGELLAGAAGALVAAAAPAAPAPPRGGPLALVTADLEARIVVVDLTTRRVLRRLASPGDPRSIERVGERAALVAHTAEGVLSLVDAGAMRVGRVVRGVGEPRYTAARAEDGLAYVTDSAAGDLLTVDVRRGRVVRRTALGGPARHVSLGPGRRRLWAALGNTAREVAVVDVSDALRPRLLRRVRPPFLAHDVAVAPDGRSVWVTSGDRGALAVYDAARLEPRLMLAADAPPQHVAFGERVAYVTSGDDGTLHVHALGDGRRRASAAVPVGSFNVHAGHGRVVAPSLSAGTLAILDLRATPVARRRVAIAAHDACVVEGR
jgi:hyaluronoglucosaminidase